MGLKYNVNNRGFCLMPAPFCNQFKYSTYTVVMNFLLIHTTVDNSAVTGRGRRRLQRNQSGEPENASERLGGGEMWGRGGVDEGRRVKQGAGVKAKGAENDSFDRNRIFSKN